MHISDIVNYVKNEINFSREFCEDNVFVTLRIEPIITILQNLEESHKDIISFQEDIIKKDKIIALMAEQLTTPIHSKEWVIEYYTKKVEEE